MESAHESAGRGGEAGESLGHANREGAQNAAHRSLRPPAPWAAPWTHRWVSSCVSTTIILRSIADIAASEGEDRATSTRSSPASSSRWASHGCAGQRRRTATSPRARARHRSPRRRASAQKGLAKEAARAGAAGEPHRRAIRVVVSRDRGAAGARDRRGGRALINTLFIAHYQDMARGHFIVRRLKIRAEPVRLAYGNRRR